MVNAPKEGEKAMLNIFRLNDKMDGDAIWRGMFRDRKRVFVDILKWNVPVIGDYEIDHFDNEDAEYIIISDPETGAHWGSMRMLRTDRPHILDSLFPMLCEGEVPCGPDIRELTRLCLSPDLRARDRRKVRNRLFTSAVEYALMTGITNFTGVASLEWHQQLLALGWRAWPLGLPQIVDGDQLAAAMCEIDGETINLFRQAGTYDSGDLIHADTLLRAA